MISTKNEVFFEQTIDTFYAYLTRFNVFGAEATEAAVGAVFDVEPTKTTAWVVVDVEETTVLRATADGAVDNAEPTSVLFSVDVLWALLRLK